MGTENGLEVIGEGAGPNIALPDGMRSGVIGDGGTFGLELGDGHRVVVTEEVESPPPRLPDSWKGSTTVGRGGVVD